MNLRIRLFLAFFVGVVAVLFANFFAGPLAAIIVGWLYSAAATFVLSRYIAAPLGRLTKAVRELSLGQAPLLPPSEDELGELSRSFNELAQTLAEEVEAKGQAFVKLEQYQKHVLDLNRQLGKRLFENKVMLTLWQDQEKLADTKEFLSAMLEELLQGLPFSYGCIIIRPLAQIGPEVVLARVDRRRRGHDEITVTDIMERTERTLWLHSLSPELKDFLLRQNEQLSGGVTIVQSGLTASIEPSSRVAELSVASVGLAQGKHHIGAVHLISDRPRFDLSPTDRDFLLNVASQVSVLLENRSLQYSTRVDTLTRLYNRGYMMDRLREEITRTSRTDRPFTFLMLDVDHFKKINDTYGHPAGDEILIALSALLKRSCRASDAICRYGGEEIGIILADTAVEGARIFAENIRKAIESQPFLVDGLKPIQVTASMGFAQYRGEPDLTLEEIIKRADGALYAAKHGGRNQWRAYEDGAI